MFRPRNSLKILDNLMISMVLLYFFGKFVKVDLKSFFQESDPIIYSQFHQHFKFSFWNQVQGFQESWINCVFKIILVFLNLSDIFFAYFRERAKIIFVIGFCDLPIEKNLFKKKSVFGYLSLSSVLPESEELIWQQA